MSSEIQLIKKRLALARKNTMARGQVARKNSFLISEERVNSHISPIRTFLQLPYEDREEYLAHVIPVVGPLKFFRALSEDRSQEAMRECLKRCGYEFVSENSFVIRQNERGSKFYIILSGSVRILKDDPMNLDCDVPDHIEVGSLKTGDSFGERALMLGLPRMASIYADTDCHFATLDYIHYKQVLNSVFDEQFKLMSSLLRSLPTLKEMSKNRLQKICYYFKKKSFAKREVVYSTGEPVRSVYFIHSGEVRVSKKVTLHNDSLRSLNKNVTRTIQVAALGNGEVFGEEDVLDGKTNRDCTTTAFSDAIVYVISKENFMKLVLNNEEGEQLKKKTIAKQHSRNERIQQSTHLLRLKMGIIPLKVEDCKFDTDFKIKIDTPALRKRPSADFLTTPKKESRKMVFRPMSVYLGEKNYTPKEKQTKKFVNYHVQMLKRRSFSISTISCSHTTNR